MTNTHTPTLEVKIVPTLHQGELTWEAQLGPFDERGIPAGLYVLEVRDEGASVKARDWVHRRGIQLPSVDDRWFEVWDALDAKEGVWR